MYTINSNAVQGHMSENYLMQKIIAQKYLRHEIFSLVPRPLPIFQCYNWPGDEAMKYSQFTVHVLCVQYLNFLSLHTIGGNSDLAMEAALGKCRRLVVWCSTYNYPSPPPLSHSSTSAHSSASSHRHSGSTIVLAYSIILEAVLSKVHVHACNMHVQCMWMCIILSKGIYHVYS